MNASRTLVRASRLLAMTLTCLGAVNARAEVVRNPNNPRYLKDSDTGEALLLTGFGSLVFATARDFHGEIEDMRRNGVHYVRAWPLRYDAGLMPWTLGSGPFETEAVQWGWNDVYWNRFEEALSHAEAAGMYIEVMLYDTTRESCNGWEPWTFYDPFPCGDFKTPGHSWRVLHTAWVEQILEKTRDHKKVFYEIENEPRQTFGPFKNQEQEWSETWAAFVKTYADQRGLTRRVVAINPPRDQTSRIGELSAWNLANIDILNYHAPIAPLPDLRDLHRELDDFAVLGKVVSMDEFANGACQQGCEDGQPGRNRIRREGWTAIGSGTHFHIEDIEGPLSNPDIVGPMLANIEAFKGFWSFWRFSPSNEPEVTSEGSTTTTFCMRRGDAREYVCYLPELPPNDDRITITLPPSPLGGWQLQCWDPRSTVHDYECDIPSRDDRHITANLPPPSEPSLDLRDWVLHISAVPVQYHQLALTLTGAGSGVVSSNGILCTDDCTLPFPEGTVVNLSAAPQAGSSFLGFGGGGCEGQNPCQVTLSADLTVSARFEPLRRLTVVRTGNGFGRVTGPGIDCGTDCTEDYPHGTVVTLTAAANPDSTLQSWTGCDSVNGSNCIVTMNAARTVTAQFVLRTYLFTVTKLGSGSGTVASTFPVTTPPGIVCGTDCSETYTHYQPVRLRITPAPGFTFVGWGGSCQGTQSTCDVVVDGPEAVTATFAPPAPVTRALQYYPVQTPCRVLDTRPNSPLLHLQQRTFQITGACVPAAASSVAAVVTAVAPTGGGNIGMNGGPLALTSVANFPSAGGAWASSVVTSLTPQGQVIAQAALLGGGSTHLVIDVTGYFAAPGASGQNFTPFATPTRLYDTTVAAGVEKLFKIGGTGFPSAPASAVALSVAAVDTPAVGHVAVYPSGAGAGGTSSLNYQGGVQFRIYNGTIARLGSLPTGNLAALSTQSHRLLIDINGVFHAPAPGSLQYHIIKPCRVMDTRGGGPVLPAGNTSFPVRGMCGAIPDSARAVTANFAVIGPAAQGHLAFSPTGGQPPSAGHLLYAPGWTIGSGAVLPLSSSPAPIDDLTVFTVAPTHLVVDITGYFSPAP